MGCAGEGNGFLVRFVYYILCIYVCANHLNELSPLVQYSNSISLHFLDTEMLSKTIVFRKYFCKGISWEIIVEKVSNPVSLCMANSYSFILKLSCSLSRVQNLAFSLSRE